ncbi:MAG: hypothetical protein Q4C03_03835 [bacterium]|nr:hypothetical protein [bacterium]
MKTNPVTNSTTNTTQTKSSKISPDLQTPRADAALAQIWDKIVDQLSDQDAEKLATFLQTNPSSQELTNFLTKIPNFKQIAQAAMEEK